MTYGTAPSNPRTIEMALLSLWPLTLRARVQCQSTAPISYLFRPYIVYRSRAPRGHREA